MEEAVHSDEALIANWELRIFPVPESLRSLKTEAYAPRLIGMGPFHHFRPRLYKMEAHKLAVAKRGLQRFNVPDFQALVREIQPRIPRIRACYTGGGGGLSSEKLAMVTAIDGLFFLELIRGDDADLPGLCKPPTSGGQYFFEYLQPRSLSATGKIIADICRSFGQPLPFDPRAAAGRKPPLHSIALNDAVLLENQIPIWIVAEALTKFRPDAGRVLARDLDSFCRLVSPLALPDRENDADGALPLHLLEYLYLKLSGGGVEPDGAVARIPVDPDLDIHREILQTTPDCLWAGKSRESGTKVGIEPNHSSLLALISAQLPSATDLRDIGLKFQGKTGDLRIELDEGSKTITIPTFRWSPYSEVVMRNLVIYEAMAKPSLSSTSSNNNNENDSHVLLLIQYIHFMHMITRQPNDVRFLMETGVIEPSSSSEEAGRILRLLVHSLCTCCSSGNTLLDRNLSLALNKHCNGTAYRAVRRYYCARRSVVVRKFAQLAAFCLALVVILPMTLISFLNTFAGGVCQFVKFYAAATSVGNCVAAGNIAMFVNGTVSASSMDDALALL